MPSDPWEEVEALQSFIVKAVREGLGNEQVSGETFSELLTEGKIAAYEALKRYEPAKGEKAAWVFRSVVQHIRRVLKNYRPSGKPLPDEVNEEVLEKPVLTDETTPLSPLAIAVLLAAAPPIERLYVLHELLDWDKSPPRYAKTRLKRRWQEHEWVRLVVGNVRKGWERHSLLKQLDQMARKGDDYHKGLAGFAIAALPLCDLSEEATKLLRSSVQTLLCSENPHSQFAGLWALNRLQPEAWDERWIEALNINTLGSVLKARYTKPVECLCPSPLCLHYHPDTLQHQPPPQVIGAIAGSLVRYADQIAHELGARVRWRGWWLARALGLYMQFSPKDLTHFFPSKSRIVAMLLTIALAHAEPQQSLEQAFEWLPRAPTVEERLHKALKSPEPLERVSALYATGAFPLEERLSFALLGLSDSSVLVRFAARRILEDRKAWEPLYRELMRPHEHKRLLHRAILNLLARLDLERTLDVAAEIYRGQGKEAWREDAWLRHDAGYILLTGVLALGRLDLLEVFRSVLEHETHPSPLVLLPAVQAFLRE